MTFQNIDDELKDLARKYTEPERKLLVAIDIRGNAGGQLIKEILERAKQEDYKEMVLYTIVHLQSAIHLYRKFGFAECEPYYNNPMNDVIYMKKKL